MRNKTPIPDFPPHVAIQTGSSCNGKCIMCPYPSLSREIEHGKISWELYEKIIKECSQHNVVRISPLLFEEPLMEKDIVNFINYAKDKNRKTQINITTNASLLTPGIAEKLAYSKLDIIFISFQGITKPTYESVTGLDYDASFNNILNFIEVVKKKPKLPFKMKKPLIVISSVRTRPVADELEIAEKFWKSLGVSFITGPFDNFGGHLPDFREKCIPEEKVRRTDFCERPFTQIFITFDGKAVICCADYKKQVVLGDLNRENIHSIWNNDKYREIRRRFQESDINGLPLCGDCLTACQVKEGIC